MTKTHFIPEGETIFIHVGRYKFVGPLTVELDPSFQWPLTYESGIFIDYGKAPVVKKKSSKKKVKKDGSTEKPDTTVGLDGEDKHSEIGGNADLSVGDSGVREGSDLGEHSSENRSEP